ncbi:FecCD family ABC transporter permease [Rhodomicrobium lacus]|jgi:iron complex transport system permease protein|uniref:FecCD family ABC transporter permease n=1 Tax=Rhodomicrobium TaxID=1068 RepID=UPI0026E2872D|nr:iron ABC transporter permease [Rhodomicrobium lacus]WKW51255.1 iron ABC transporter permease [Rhodomicrobium lacus]
MTTTCEQTQPLVSPPGLAIEFLLVLALIAAVLASLCIGVYPVPLDRTAQILWSLIVPWQVDVNWTDAEQVAVQVIRLPRVLLVTLAGMGLGISGAALQGMMRNPLVGPDLVGISAGAATGAVLAILFGFPSIAIVATAFAGGMLALLCASTLARAAKGGGVLAFVLAGVIVSAFFHAIQGIVQYTADPETKLPSMVYWLMGSFASADQTRLAILAVPVLVGGGLLMALRWRINLLSLGEIDAAALGVNVTRLRWAIIALVSFIVAAQVSVSGIVGWVGMVVPHFARMLTGPNHTRLLPTAALIGGLFLLLMDDLARSVTMQELPIGLITAAVGTPVFAVLFWRAQAKGWNHD